MAPRYSDLWSAFKDTAEEDILIVIGTSGVVLPVNAMASAHEGLRILNNLQPESAIDDSHFEQTFYKPATQAVDEIDAILRKHFQ